MGAETARLQAWVLAALIALPAAAAAVPAPITLSPPPGLAGFEQATLDNGLSVLLGTAARPVAFTEGLLVVEAGTSSRGPGGEENARIAAEAFLGGRLPGDKAVIRQRLARTGVTLDYTVGREVAVFRFAVPARNTAAFLHLLSGLLARRTLSGGAWQEAIARRQQVEAGEQADAWQRSLKTLDGLIWREPGGEAGAASPRPLTAVDLESLAAFHAATYTVDRMVLCLWGETPTPKLRALVQGELGRLRGASRREPAAEIAEPVLKPAGGVRCVQAAGAAPPALLIGLGAELEDDRAFYGWQLAAHILGASHSSRLHDRLRVREPFVYTVEATCSPVGSRGLTLHIAAQTAELERVRAVVMEELQRLLGEEVSQEELDLARAIFRSRLLLDSGSFRDQFYRRALSLLSSRPQRDLDQGPAALDALTPASLLAILRRTLRPDAATAVVVSEKAEAVCERGPS
jgi:predicted Zn-dependent peptidase